MKDRKQDRDMNKKLIYALIGLAVIFFVTSLFIFLKSGGEPKEQSVRSFPVETGEETREPVLLKVQAFFFTEGSWLMRPVEYELPLTHVKEQGYRVFLERLLKGEADYIVPVPEGVSLRSIYFIERQNMIVVDFSEELIHRFPGGTRAELEFIYFIVNNICYNFKEVKKVKFLVSGNEYQTLSGHVDIENPFFPEFRYMYIKN